MRDHEGNHIEEASFKGFYSIPSFFGVGIDTKGAVCDADAVRFYVKFLHEPGVEKNIK